MSNKRTTELLREGLAERNIEWRSGLEGVTFAGDWCFVEYDGGKLSATCEPTLTPEQAIAATLSTETCEMEYVSEFMSWHCKACDQMDMAPRNPKPRYCKWCGRKVVDR